MDAEGGMARNPNRFNWPHPYLTKNEYVVMCVRHPFLPDIPRSTESHRCW